MNARTLILFVFLVPLLVLGVMNIMFAGALIVSAAIAFGFLLRSGRGVFYFLTITVVGIFLFYMIGMHVRQSYGLRIDIRNESGEVIHGVNLKFVGWRYQHEAPIPDLSPGQRGRYFVKLARKSNVGLEFIDSRNLRHSENAEEYVYPNSCSSVAGTVNPSGIVNFTVANPLICGESWFGLTPNAARF